MYYASRLIISEREAIKKRNKMKRKMVHRLPIAACGRNQKIGTTDFPSRPAAATKTFCPRNTRKTLKKQKTFNREDTQRDAKKK
jgi:hypothetical protein